MQFTCALIICTIAVTSAQANTCPKNLKQDTEGYWYSSDKPLWRSHKPTAPNVTVSTSSFGGAVYSPVHHRLACLYKDSEGKWIAIVSNANYTFAIDKSAMDDSKTKPAWKWNEKYKDYSCGQPHVKKIENCPFTINDADSN